jgi:hypothetical protein
MSLISDIATSCIICSTTHVYHHHRPGLSPSYQSSIVHQSVLVLVCGFYVCIIPHSTYTPADAPKATRQLSSDVLNALAKVCPELMGGSADLTPSNLTDLKGGKDFQKVN